MLKPMPPRLLAHRIAVALPPLSCPKPTPFVFRRRLFVDGRSPACRLASGNRRFGRESAARYATKPIR